MNDQTAKSYERDTKYIDSLGERINPGETRFLRACAKASAAGMDKLQFVPFVCNELQLPEILVLALIGQLAPRGIITGIFYQGQTGLRVEITRRPPHEPANDAG